MFYTGYLGNHRFLRRIVTLQQDFNAEWEEAVAIAHYLEKLARNHKRNLDFAKLTRGGNGSATG